MLSTEQIHELPEHVRAALAWVRLNPEAFGFGDIDEVRAAISRAGHPFYGKKSGDQAAVRILAAHILNES